MLIIFLSGSSAVAIVVGVRRNRPVTAWPWLLFALGQALFFLGDVYTYLYPKLLGHEVPFPSIGDGLYLAMYPVLMVGVLLIVRRRNPEGDRAGVIDALIITVGVGLLSWFFLMAPYVHDATLSPLAKSVSIAYPLGDVLLLAAVLRLVFDGGRRQGSFYLLVTAVLTLFVTDAAYGYALLDGSYDHQLIYDAGWIGYYLLWGAAALNPTMRNLVEPTPDRERRLSRLAARPVDDRVRDGAGHRDRPRVPYRGRRPARHHGRLDAAVPAGDRTRRRARPPARARRVARARPAQCRSRPGVGLDVGGDPRGCARDGNHPRRRRGAGAPVPRDPDRSRALHSRASRRSTPSRSPSSSRPPTSTAGGPLGHDSRLQLEVPALRHARRSSRSQPSIAVAGRSWSRRRRRCRR